MENTFDIKKVARDYVYKRFTLASIPEKEKIISDWESKIEDSKYLVEDFKRRVGDPRGKTILDAGSGNGGISIAFALSGAIPTGIDIEKDLYEISIEHAKFYNQKIEYHLYDGFIMPFNSNSFDYAVSASVLEHTTDPVLYLKEIMRVVKPGGILYLGFPNKFAFKETHTGVYFLTYLPAFLRPIVLKVLKRNPLEENNLHFYSYSDLLKMIKESRGDFKWEIIKEKGQNNSGIKGMVKRMLSIFGIEYKAILPHILVLLRKVRE